MDYSSDDSDKTIGIISPHAVESTTTKNFIATNGLRQTLSGRTTNAKIQNIFSEENGTTTIVGFK
jgi:hypothetical protein